jgi:2-polyprenyl-3-methyl-5-hydroxy-6-metoxy-1,4-benzoquinol methylase
MSVQSSEIICDFCGSTEVKTIRPESVKKNVEIVVSSSSNTPLLNRLVKCRKCSLVQVDHNQSGIELIQSYQDVIDETHAENSHLRIKSFLRALSKIEAKVPDFSSESKSRLVDIGSASGEFPYAATLKGYRATGFEPSVHLSDLGRRKYKIDIRTGVFTSMAVNQEEIDIVTLWDVLEHVDSPKELLVEVTKTLKPGGYLVLNLPMIDTISAQAFRFKWPFYLHVHLFYFTNKTIRQYLRKFQFEVVYCRSYSQTLSIDYLVRRATSGKVKNFPIKWPLCYRMGQRTIVARRVG